MKKRISKWLAELPDGYRELALQNFAEGGNENELADRLEDALLGAFTWGKAPQGHSFWSEIYAGNFPEIPSLGAELESEHSPKTLLDEFAMAALAHLPKMKGEADLQDCESLRLAYKAAQEMMRIRKEFL